LTCPEVKDILHVTFVGLSGQYFVVAGRRDVVLWDLVSASVLWHCSVDHLIQRIISHSKDNSFAITQSIPGPSRSTRILVFKPSSSSPVRQHTLPFTLRQLAFFPTHSKSHYNMVAITHNWSVVIVGDDVDWASGGDQSMVNIPDQGPSTRKTLLQDIFGVSALVEETSKIPAVHQSSTRPLSKYGALEAPAHTAPPLSTIFSPIMDRLIQRRKNHSSLPSNHEEVITAPDRTVDTVPIPPPVPDVDRIVTRDELSSFAELFKTAMTKSQPSSNNHTNGNGVHSLPNGSSTQLLRQNHEIEMSSDPPEAAATGKRKRKSRI